MAGDDPPDRLDPPVGRDARVPPADSRNDPTGRAADRTQRRRRRADGGVVDVDADGADADADAGAVDTEADEVASDGARSSEATTAETATAAANQGVGGDATGPPDAGTGAADGDDPSSRSDEVATVRSSTELPTNHWLGVAGVSFLTAGVGVVARSRPLLLAAVVGVTYLAYASATGAPEPTLAVSRRLSEPNPEPGEQVTVSVTVANAGSTTLWDVRLVDAVPEALSVLDGPARAATALRPGAGVTFSYVVTARRGEYSFDELTAIVRNASGSREREVTLATPATTLTCVPPQDSTETVPLRSLTAPYTGRVPTDATGDGVEFASLREYQHGDPISRLDWNRYARDGQLATMEFRQERMATVVVLLDLRTDAYVQAGPDGPHAVDRGIDAARRLFNSLLDTGDRVGLAALSRDDVWLAPGAGPTHRAKARHLLATHPALSPTPPPQPVYVRLGLRTLVARLSDDAQVVFCSPLSDAASAYVARSLHVRGHPVTVVSPEPTTRETTGGTLASVERSNRLNDLRTSGVRVLDWRTDEALLEALERARRRWSA